MKSLLLLSTAAILITAAPASADPITGAIAAVLGGGAVATAIAQVAVGLAFNFISGALAKAFQKTPRISVKFDVQMGDTLPLSFTVGEYVTPGKRKYIGSWGPRTKYITEIIEVSCMPQGFNKMWVNDELATIDWGTLATEDERVASGWTIIEDDDKTRRRPTFTTISTQLGYPITNGNFKHRGNSTVFIRWKDGNQIAADTTLTTIFGNDPDYPFTSDMVGAGKTYAIVTVLYNQDVMSSYPTFLFEPDPLALYDPRKDSTVGGSGSHRWGQFNTYEPTANNAVICYNIARGIYYEGEWVFGGKNLSSWRLPLPEWVTAMNACDASVGLAGGGTEPAYRGGAEITVDMEPLSVIEQIGVAGNMRFSEVGGRLKPLVGTPGASVFSITDGDIIITEGQDLKPFNSLSETYNRINASYPEREEKWTDKEAPEYILPNGVDIDGQDLPLDMSYSAAPFRLQVQRLMRSQLSDSRRQIVHEFMLPPRAYGIEPLDMVTWTSVRNGYVNKNFIVEAVNKHPGMRVQVVLREVDPSDYDWSSGYQLPTNVVPIPTVYSEVQGIFNFTAVPSTVVDGSSRARIAAIQVGCNPGEPNIRNARVKITKAGSTNPTVDTMLPYQAPFLWNIVGVAPNTEYEVIGALVPERTSDPYEWSNPISVTTPVILQSIDDLEAAIAANLTVLDTWITTGFDLPADVMALATTQRTLLEQMRTFAAELTEGSSQQVIDVQASASAINALTVLVTENNNVITAIADSLQSLTATVGQSTAQGLLRISAEATPEGALSRIGLKVAASTGEHASIRSAALYLEARANDESTVIINTDKFAITNGQEDQTIAPFIVVDGVVYVANLRVSKDVIVDGAVSRSFLSDPGSFTPVTGTSDTVICGPLVGMAGQFEPIVMNANDRPRNPLRVEFTFSFDGATTSSALLTCEARQGVTGVWAQIGQSKQIVGQGSKHSIMLSFATNDYLIPPVIDNWTEIRISARLTPGSATINFSDSSFLVSQVNR